MTHPWWYKTPEEWDRMEEQWKREQRLELIKIIVGLAMFPVAVVGTWLIMR